MSPWHRTKQRGIKDPLNLPKAKCKLLLTIFHCPLLRNSRRKKSIAKHQNEWIFKYSHRLGDKRVLFLRRIFKYSQFHKPLPLQTFVHSGNCCYKILFFLILHADFLFNVRRRLFIDEKILFGFSAWNDGMKASIVSKSKRGPWFWVIN